MYLLLLTSIVLAVFLYLSYVGYDYYSTPLTDRFYHERHNWFKPSGVMGHGLGIIGTLLILIGVTMYIARKRSKFLSRFGKLKYWLEFHIFLCTLGPIMVLFHTAFKFGGIVSIAFWSMVAVVLSGVIGRFIYIQIPRSIEGRELSLAEIQNSKASLNITLNNIHNFTSEDIKIIEEYTHVDSSQLGFSPMDILNNYLETNSKINELNQYLSAKSISKKDQKTIVKIVKQEININKKIARLQLMQKLFKYWHVAHLPFALIMLVIVLIHIGVTVAFGSHWIF